jgi:hypothetical protein
MSPEDSQRVLSAFRMAHSAWVSLHDYLETHPDTSELLNAMAKQLAIIQTLKPLVDVDEWPEIINDTDEAAA